MPGLLMLLGMAVLIVAGIAVRERTEVISNTAFILAAVLLILAILAFTRTI
ncbi:MAG: hypothetical protein LLP51_07340 [Halorhodospira halophila]|uniref:hypothetical protein n=1 Tax=Halorhodospira TaxID=85108 RepID=UPI00191363BB|nr:MULTISPECIES: hypothetical protein [Halorhodospira]MCC3751192.1 hypothetical protein [Halorhodospira halophila]MCG5526750.1 hypothetical protein [Halorhodospira halophila]MCG5533804.1 hypothetical protein [Halorhodospira sp. 9621]MCG5539306.1 hypothetical protein [Halorhodospira sp. 9622]MCG5540769.1 hypothetical protein [Halorhodospira sp. M39old]